MNPHSFGMIKASGLLIVLLAATLFSSSLVADDCTSADITLSTQAEVDAFQATYGGATPPCDTVTGNLRIGGADIANVDGLSALTSVGGRLEIVGNTALTNVDGLAALTSVGGLMYVLSNAILTNVDGLSALTSVGWFVNISSNAALTNVDGLSALTSVGNYLYIQSNAVLTNLDGLAALISVGTSLLIQNNPQLAVCYALAPLLDDVDDALPGPGPWPYPGGVPDVGEYPRLLNNLPGCNSVDQILSVRPPEGTAVIAIQKLFADRNAETGVELTLQCSSGTYGPKQVTAYPDPVPPPRGQIEHIFVISEIPLADGNGATCSVIETPVHGYSTEYKCPQSENMSASDASCNVAYSGIVPDDNTACQWSDVQIGDSNNCLIVNTPEPVEIKVTKVWDFSGAPGSEINLDTEINITCNAYISGSTACCGNLFTIQKPLQEPDYQDGIATVTVSVYPSWYSASELEAGDGNFCFAEETGVSSAVEVDNSECGDREQPGMEVTAGSSDGCTIYNTLFFEGIPTLNQWGMAMMALLMLGLGMVGFRRFA